MKIDKSWIKAQAVNDNALRNGLAIFQNGQFLHLYQSEDETFYMGECQGSGSKTYTTSVDFEEQQHPVFRCNCPSRQFPCKHSIALLYAIQKQTGFSKIDIPEDILKKRERLKNRKDGKEEETSQEQPKKTKNTRKTANKKRFESQLEGIQIAMLMVKDIMTMGLAAFTNSKVSDYEAIARQMSDHYIPGVQKQILQLIYEGQRIRQSETNAEYDRLIKQIIDLQAFLKKAQGYLTKKMAQQPCEKEEAVLEEKLGHIWKLKELKEEGWYVENQELIQLGFRVTFEEALQEYHEEGFWFVLPLGEVHKTINIRPKKALKYIKEEDSFLDCIITPCLYLYPGQRNQRIRYEEGFTTRSIQKEDRMQMKQHALSSLPAILKDMKNQLKNPMADEEQVVLVHYHAIEQAGDNFVLIDKEGNKLPLTSMEGTNLHALEHLPQEALLRDQCALILFSYDGTKNQIIARLMSIISDEHIVRLLY